ncbi:MAG: recombinase family protein [Clostridia bacterium]|nr:recombinase family protein [Clostridia bacterium]
MRFHSDETRSGTSDNREQFQRMIEDSIKRTFNVVNVHKQDRFARNRYDSAIYKKKLKDNGIKFISVLERFDDSPESILLESLVEGMAEYYSANLARETMKGLKENAHQCKFNGGRWPLGYSITDEGRYEINPLEAIIVQKIFNMYADGYSYQDLCNRLNSDGYRTHIGKLFSKNCLHDILTNERYTGVYVFNKAVKKSKRKLKDEAEVIRIPGGIPAIIDNKTFERVKLRMKVQASQKAKNKAKVNYLLTGLLFCGECGSAMVGNRRTRADKVYASYECGGRKRKHDCKAKSITKEKIEAQVLEKLEKEILSNESIDMLTEMVLEYAENNLKEVFLHVETLAKEMKEVQS